MLKTVLNETRSTSSLVIVNEQIDRPSGRSMSDQSAVNWSRKDVDVAWLICVYLFKIDGSM